MAVLTPLFFFFGGVGIKFFLPTFSVHKFFKNMFVFYLVAIIGLKGGVGLASQWVGIEEVLGVLSGAVLCCLLQPFVAYFLLSKTTTLSRVDKAAISAHYGSISLLTFLTAASFLSVMGVTYQGYMVAVLAVMEIPAIFVGLFLAGKKGGHMDLLKKVFLHPSIFLLVGMFVVGCVGQEMLQASPWYQALITPFSSFLYLFLIQMGITVMEHKNVLKQLDVKLALFGIYMPLVGASIGLFVSKLLALDVGSGTLFVTLSASASYIAVPAVMRTALSEAKEALYFPLVLAITFPFNVIFGIPLYYKVTSMLL